MSETPAVIGTAADSAAESRSPETFSRDERREWLQTGKVPSATPVEADDDPEPAAAPAAASAAPAAPTGPDLSRWVKTPPPPGVSKRQHERNELIRHATETEQRLRDLETQLQQRPAPAPPKTDQAPPAQDYDGTDPNDPFPDSIDAFAEDADPYAAMIRAQFKHEQRKEARVAQHLEQRTTAERTATEKHAKYVERAHAYAQTKPEFAAKTATVRANIHPQSPMAAWLMDSPVSPQLLEHLSDHPEDFQRIARATSFEAAHAAFVRLEARFEPPSSSTTPAADSPAPPAQAPKLVSSAPPPPPTLGTRPAESADEERAAVARDDFAAYKRAADRKDQARRRGQ